ncbi:uncharacterized protein [Periplaneta americana]|uniref:uncharacterized protein isoform X2 n=1 Tax=Periplaneta americana TaxID=6978 RepID=UPI0037E80441
MTCLMCHQLVVHASGPPPRGRRRRHNFNRLLIFLLMCCCYCTVVVQPLLQLEESEGSESLLLERRETADQDYYRDDEDQASINDEDEEETNTTELGSFLGAPCELTCDSDLPHVFCDQITRHCECEKKYPVKLGAKKGCAKPVRLGDQCFYRQTCAFTDQHATCIQINHNAVCQCKPGYHTVALQRPTKKVFCSEDLVILTTDVPTLFGVATGLAIFTALICFVLKLFSRARYSRPRHYANANLAPPILFSSETGIPLAVHGGRPSSRASSQRSVGTIASGFSRRPSSGGSRGVLVPASRAGAARAAAILLISCHLTTTTATAASEQTSTDDNSQPDPEQQQQQRAGSRRPSIASIHSSASSSRSYSARRFERENMQREQRQLQLQMQQLQMQQDNLKPGAAPTPSPKTPMSTDELLPSVSEVREESHHSTPTMNNVSSSSSSSKGGATTSYQGYN